MDELTVHRLRLRAPPARAQAVRTALEDALRTALPDERRLVLVRRITVAGTASTAWPGHTQRLVQAAWAVAVGDARHGGSQGAEGANCVWFESRSEAAALLLARLLAGQTVSAWFWPLALPDWRGVLARAWLDRCLTRAMAADEPQALLTLVETALAGGAANLVVEVLAGGSGPAPPRSTAGIHSADAHMARPASPPPAGSHNDRELGTLAAAIPLVVAQATLLRRLGRAGGTGPEAARALARALALRHSPALALAPRLLEALAERLAGIRPLDLPFPTRTAAPAAEQPVVEPSRRTPDGGPGPPSPSARAPAAAQTQRNLESRATTLGPRRPTEAPVPEAGLAPPSPPDDWRPPAVSAHAGLWLALPALIDCGFREWLLRHPDRLAEHPGRQVIRAIASRHRVPPGDPAIAVLGADEVPLTDWAGLWARALDGWLRRRARRRLHDLVHRPGWVLAAETRLQLSFPIAAIDMRLRRRALDRDPGWTDWLGLSVYYHYHEGERPGVGP
jgi:hypothetical protein